MKLTTKLGLGTAVTAISSLIGAAAIAATVSLGTQIDFVYIAENITAQGFDAKYGAGWVTETGQEGDAAPFVAQGDVLDFAGLTVGQMGQIYSNVTNTVSFDATAVTSTAVFDSSQNVIGYDFVSSGYLNVSGFDQTPAEFASSLQLLGPNSSFVGSISTVAGAEPIVLDDPQVAAVPLPAAGWLLIASLGGLGLAGRHKKA